MKIILLSLLSILIVAVSWVMNFGFIRIFCLSLFLPFIHAMIVFAICLVAATNGEYKKIRLYNLMFCITYVLSNVLLPEVGLDCRMFFGLVTNEFICNLGLHMSIVLLIIHIILLVLIVIETERIDRKKEKEFLS